MSHYSNGHSKLYVYKKLEVGFVILCHNQNIELVKSTANSLRKHYAGMAITCITAGNTSNEDLKKLKQICPTFKGKDTLSSLINTGLRNAPTEWSIFILAGSWVRPKLDERFSYFVETDKDILFPIADNKYTFTDGTLNGLFINRRAIKDIGPFSDNPLEVCKLMWALSAIKEGYKFKAIAGTKIC